MWEDKYATWLSPCAAYFIQTGSSALSNTCVTGKERGLYIFTCSLTTINKNLKAPVDSNTCQLLTRHGMDMINTDLTNRHYRIPRAHITLLDWYIVSVNNALYV